MKPTNSILLLVLALISLIGVDARAASSRYPTAVTADTPLAHWRLGESAGPTARDASSNARDGTYQGSDTDYTFSKMVSCGDRGVSFLTNAASVQVGNVSSLNPTNITIEAIVNLTGATASEQRIVEKSTTSGATQPQYSLTVLSDGKLNFRFTTSSLQTITSPSALTSGVALHLAASYNGTVAKLYVNGVEVQSSAISGNIATSSAQPVVIGNLLTGSRAFNGTIDEVALFSTGLSAGTIQAHMAAVAQRAPISIDTPTPSNTSPAITSLVTTTFPVQFGVPIPDEDLYSIANARLVNNSGTEVSAQFKVLGRWRKFANGSYPADSGIPISWLRVAFIAPASLSSSATYYLEYGPWTTGTFTGSMATASGNNFIVNTGPTGVKFQVNRDNPNLFDQVWIDLDNNGTIGAGESIIASGATPHGLYFIDQSNGNYRAGYDATGTTLVVEDDGPEQVTLKATGHYRLSGVTNSDDNEWIVRYRAYKGKPYVRVFATLVVVKSSASRRYKDIGIETRLTAMTLPTTGVAFYTGYTAPLVMKPDIDELVQYGSSWQTPSTATSPHNLIIRSRRSDDVYLSRAASQLGGFNNRFGGYWDIQGSNAAGSFGLLTTLRWAWQQYPNAFEWLEDAPDQLARTHLWWRGADSADSSIDHQLSFLPLEYLKGRGKSGTFESGAGAQSIFSTQILAGCILLPNEYPPNDATYGFSSGSCTPGCLDATGVGLAKTWELMFEFHRGNLTGGVAAAPQETAFLTQRPVIGIVDPQWLRDSVAMGRIAATNASSFPEVDARPACTTDADCQTGRKCRLNGLCQNMLDLYYDRLLLERQANGEDASPHGPAYPADVPPDDSATRAWGSSYGAFEFGDILQGGKRAHRYWMHNRYWSGSINWIWYARSGDRRAYEFGESASRHIMDLDTNHVQYDVNWACTSPTIPGTSRMPKGAGRIGDLGYFHWATSRPVQFACQQFPNGSCDDSVYRVHMISAPDDSMSGGVKYYYLTGYERELDVANETAAYIATAAARPSEEYWTQTENRGLGGGLQNVSDLFGLVGGASLETVAKKIAAEMIGVGTGVSGDELASNRVCPRPKTPGIAFSQGAPCDVSSVYMGPGAVAYIERATEAVLPARSSMVRWIKDQALAIDAHGFQKWPNSDTNTWVIGAGAYAETTDAIAKAHALRQGLTEYQSVKLAGWNDFQEPASRAFSFYGLPYLLDAIKDSSTAIPTSTDTIAVTSGSELQFNKVINEDAEVTLRAYTVPSISLPLFAQSLVIPTLPTATSNVPYAISTGTTAICKVGSGYNCSAAIVLYDPAGNEIARRPYALQDTSQPRRCATNSDQVTRTQTWYNSGGWQETLTLVGPPGIYRARVEVEGVVTGQRVESSPNTTAINFYNKPLFQLAAVHNNTAKVKAMGFAGLGDDLSPGERYDKAVRRYAYIPSGSVAVSFTFDYQIASSVFPFAAYKPDGSAATISGGGDNVAWGVTVAGGDRDARWGFDFGPEYNSLLFGFDNVATCSLTSTPAGCKTHTSWLAESRPFTSTGVYPFYANSTSNYFAPQLLWSPVLLSPIDTSNTLSPPTTFRWRAIAAAQNYRIGWTDGNYCGVANYETVTAAAAHCGYGTGQCWLARTITPGPGHWFVQPQSDLASSSAWPWSKTQEFRYGTLLPAPTLPTVNTLSGQKFRWMSVTGATYYSLEIDDSSAGDLLYKNTTTSGAGCSGGGQCELIVSDTLASGPASWRVTANCSGNYSAANKFVVP